MQDECENNSPFHLKRAAFHLRQYSMIKLKAEGAWSTQCQALVDLAIWLENEANTYTHRPAKPGITEE